MNASGSKPNRTPFEYVTRDLLARLCERSRTAARGRVNHNFHRPEDSYQRMLNVVQPGSYIRPHRHGCPEKSESFVVLQGEIALFMFADDGRVAEQRRIGPGCETLAVDLQPGVYHCFAALRPDTVVFEGKTGPYDPSTDKQFAAWAPPEVAPEAAAYLQDLISKLPADG